MINVLFIGDIIGRDGANLMLDLLPRLKNNYNIDLAIANGENVNNGKGLKTKDAILFNDSGIDVITSGNHIWDNKKDSAIHANLPFVLRPLNYPELNPGNGFYTIKIKNNVEITVVNLQGRSFMYPIDCPFTAADKLLSEIKNKKSIVIIDLHAESTAEKQAFGMYLDGRVAAVIGTHTHVQTADERIFARGTGYITDVGMTGPYNSVIGMDSETAIKRFIYQTPFYFKTGIGDLRLNAVIIKINEKTGKTTNIERLNFSKAEYNAK